MYAPLNESAFLKTTIAATESQLDGPFKHKSISVTDGKNSPEKTAYTSN